MTLFKTNGKINCSHHAKERPTGQFQQAPKASADNKCSRIDRFAFEHDPLKGGRPVSRDGRRTPEKKKSQAPAPSSTKTGTSPASKDNRPPCFDKKKLQCTKDICDDWHPSDCILHNSDKCQDRQRCPVVHNRPTKKGRKPPSQSGSVSLCEQKLFTCAMNHEKDQLAPPDEWQYLATQYCCFEKEHPPRSSQFAWQNSETSKKHI